MRKDLKILEIGCGDGWLGAYLRQNGWTDYVGLDTTPAADIVGDIRDWRNLGLKKESYDIIIAFEVVEHVDCFKECFELLRPGGKLFLTSPVPRWDCFLKVLEHLGLSQKRTSPHDHLIDLRDVPYLKKENLITVAFISQWGILIKEKR